MVHKLIGIKNVHKEAFAFVLYNFVSVASVSLNDENNLFENDTDNLHDDTERSIRMLWKNHRLLPDLEWNQKLHCWCSCNVSVQGSCPIERSISNVAKKNCRTAIHVNSSQGLMLIDIRKMKQASKVAYFSAN